MQRALSSISSLQKPIVVANACDYSTQEVEAGKSGIEDPQQLHCQYEGSLKYLRLSQRQQQRSFSPVKQNSTQGVG